MDRRWLPGAGAALGAAAALSYHLGPPQGPPDVFQLWTAARALLHGQDAYRAVLAIRWPFPFLYPLTAAVLALPIAPFSFLAAHILWSALGGACLGYAAVHRPGLAPALLSMAFLGAASEGQWSPYLLAATAVPVLGGVWAAKPSVGLAYLVGYPSRRAVVAGLVLTGLALLISPAWPAHWLAALPSSPSRPLLMRPGGALLLLGFLRWRTPEGRLLGALALLPQTAVLYEALPIFLTARTKQEGYLLAALTHVAAIGPIVVAGMPHDAQTVQTVGWPWLLLCCYLPAIALVLRPSSPRTGGTTAWVRSC